MFCRSLLVSAWTVLVVMVSTLAAPQAYSEGRNVKFKIAEELFSVTCDSRGLPRQILRDQTPVISDASRTMSKLLLAIADNEGVILDQDLATMELIWAAQRRCEKALRINTSKAVAATAGSGVMCAELSGARPVNALDLMAAIEFYQIGALPDFDRNGKASRGDLLAYAKLAKKSIGQSISCVKNSVRAKPEKPHAGPPPAAATPKNSHEEEWPMSNPFKPN